MFLCESLDDIPDGVPVWGLSLKFFTPLLDDNFDRRCAMYQNKGLLICSKVWDLSSLSWLLHTVAKQFLHEKYWEQKYSERDTEELTKVCCLGDSEPWLLLFTSLREGDKTRSSLEIEIGVSSLTNRVSEHGSTSMEVSKSNEVILNLLHSLS